MLARRLRIARALAAAMPSDCGSWGRYTIVVHAQRQRLVEPVGGVAVGQRDHGRAVRVGQRDPHLGRQPVLVVRQAPHQHLGRGVDDLHHARPLELVAQRGVVALQGNSDQVVSSTDLLYFVGTPWWGEAGSFGTVIGL